MSKRMPRAVKRVLGTNNKNGLPEYGCKELVHGLTKVKIKKLVKLVDWKKQLPRLAAYGTDQRVDDELPYTEMLVDEVVDWGVEEAKSAGQPLQCWEYPEDCVVDWCWSAGYYAFVKPFEDHPQALVKWVVHRRSMKMRMMPEAYGYPMRKIGRRVTLEKNWWEEKCKVVNCMTGHSMRLSAELFKKPVNKGGALQGMDGAELNIQ